MYIELILIINERLIFNFISHDILEYDYANIIGS